MGQQDRPEARESWPRQAIRSFLELFALAGLAITQPLLDVFGKAPDFFVHREASRADLVAFALIVAAAPALVLWAVELAVGLAGHRARRHVHQAFVGVLVVLFGLQALNQAEVASGAVLLVVAVVGAVLGVLAYRRWAGVRTWLLYLALAPALFTGLFLTTSQASDLLASQEVAAADIAPVEDPTTVVLLQLDEWPLETVLNGDHQIDPELYPNLAELAGDGIWYRNATTAATFTSSAVPAILTGREPTDDRIAVASEYPENLFTLLASQFDLDVVESVTRLCPSNLCDGELVDHAPPPSSTDPPLEEEAVVDAAPSGLAQLLTDARQTYQAMVSLDPDATAPAETFQEDLVVATTTTTTTVPAPTATVGPDPEEAADDARDPTNAAPGDFGGVGLPLLSLQSVDDLVSSIEPGEVPTLHYLHVLLPHTPYQFLPGGRRYAVEAGGFEGIDAVLRGRSDEAAEVALEEQRLVLQAAYTDGVVGRVMDRLRSAGLYDDAIVVVVADHGVGLTPGGVARVPVGEALPRENYADLFYVPMVVKAPGLGRPGRVSDDNVITLDILPTIAGALGVDLPWPVDGIDLGSERRNRPAKRIHVVGIAASGGAPTGEPLTFDGREIQAEVFDRNVDTLLRGDNPTYRFYNIDDAGEIVGQRSDALEAAGASGATAVIEGSDAFGAIDLSTGLIPTHLVARVDAAGAGDLTVAVVVNGRVAAVSPTWPSDDEPHHLEAMLVPAFFRNGANVVELFVVGGPEGGRTLTPIALEA